MTGKSEGLDSQYPDKTQHWFCQKDKATKATVTSPFAMFHQSPCKNWHDFYEEASVGDDMAVSDSALKSGVSEQGSFVGVGSFGVVNIAMHKSTNKRVVLKKVELKGAGLWYNTNFVEEDVFSQFLLMQHPNIVQYVDFMVGLKHIAVVMLPLQGDELDDFVARNAPITETFIQSIMKQCLNALKYVHEQGLIHRDIKNDSFRFERKEPRNQGHLVLMDFGLCIAVANPRRIICGTILYMAPEVCTKKYGTPVDVWSAGVVFYTLLTGKFPFDVDPDDPGGLVVPDCCMRRCALWSRPLWRHSSGANSLLAGLMTVNAGKRLTAEQGFAHRWLRGVPDELPYADCLGGTKTAVSKEKYNTFRKKSKATGFMADDSSRPPSRAPGCLAGICCPGGAKRQRKAGDVPVL